MASDWSEGRCKRISIYLHREILGQPRNPGRGAPEGDFINRITTDCRRANLRVAHDKSQQNANVSRRRNAVSPWKGVLEVRTDGRFRGYRLQVKYDHLVVLFPTLKGPDAPILCYIAREHVARLLQRQFQAPDENPPSPEQLPSPEIVRKVQLLAETVLRTRSLLPQTSPPRCRFTCPMTYSENSCPVTMNAVPSLTSKEKNDGRHFNQS